MNSFPMASCSGTAARIGKAPLRFLRAVALAGCALILFACVSPGLVPTPEAEPSPTATSLPLFTAVPSPTPSFTPSPTQRPKAERVVIIDLDGLRPDGLLRSNIPRISELINGGAGTFSARTVVPSGTLPATASMVSGRCVIHHGIVWNDLIPSEEPLQGATVFSVAKDAGMRTVMVVGKEKLVTLARPGTVDVFRYVDEGDDAIVRTALEEASAGFGVLFVHLTLPDYFGHSVGWMSPDYLKGIGRDDTAVGVLIDGLRASGLLDDAVVILTADHGGHDQTHGTLRDEDMTIPWIVYGFGVIPAMSIQVPVSVVDTAATGVWALGLTVPSEWDGRPVVEAFGYAAEDIPVAVPAAARCEVPSG